jgi:small subunit ribosomal protein S17
METEVRKSRKSLVGEVTSQSGNKTVKVTYFYKSLHSKYLKEVRRKTVVHAHDESGQCTVGDRVRIAETRPLSRLKRWRVVSIVQRAAAI